MAVKKKTRSWLFKKRTWFAVVAAAGVILGVNLPDFWKGFGGGGPGFLGFGPPAGNGPAESETTPRAAVSTVSQTTESEGESVRAGGPSSVVKVVISERSLWLRTREGDRPIEVAEVVDLVKLAPADADGIRLRIYRKPSSRPSAESALQSALTDAGIPENAILWVPGTND